MARVIRDAWQAGAHFDSWTEEFHGEAWKTALVAAGTTAEELATRTYSHGLRLPWHVIQGTVDEEYLEREWARATRGELTPDCRAGVCGNCGACAPGVAIDLARTFGTPAPTAQPDLSAGDAGKGLVVGDAAQPPLSQSRRLGAATSTDVQGSGAPIGGRFVMVFAVEGKARFIGHLDKMELFRRAIRRAGGRLALSAGMRPKPLLSLALPLAVGLAGDAELCEFALAEAPPPDFTARLAHALPAGIRILKVEPYAETRHVSARVVAVKYEVAVESDTCADVARTLVVAASQLGQLPTLVMEEQRGDKVRRFDLKEYVSEVEVTGEGSDSALPGRASALPGRATLAFRVRVTPQGSVRPQRVVEALARFAAVELRMQAGRRVYIELA
jgi:radical SAM-linked protein